MYWKGRLLFLRDFLAKHNIELYAAELFGKGSPYDFDTVDSSNNWWTCLFPDKAYTDVPPEEAAHQLFDVANRIQPDVIIGPSIVFSAGALGLRWAKQNDKKFVMFDDGKTSQIKRNPLVQYIKDTLIGQSDGLWLPSPFYDVEYTATQRNNAHLFYGFDCIDNSLFHYQTERNYNHNVIVCVARLVPIKNIDRLLHAWQRVEQQNANYTLRFIGSGPEYETLQQLKNSLGLKRVEFAGVIANDELPEVYYNADALILSSIWESWGLVINEAMAAGLPILSTNRANAAETLMKDGINGFCFDPYNVEDIAGAILKFTALSAPQKEEMGKQSSAKIARMDYNYMGQQLLEALNVMRQQQKRKPGLFASMLIKRWNGKYNVAAWDKIT